MMGFCENGNELSGWKFELLTAVFLCSSEMWHGLNWLVVPAISNDDALRQNVASQKTRICEIRVP
jgi:hypothetical protein